MANNEIVTWHWQSLCLPASIVGLWACNQALLLPWDSINWVLGTVPVCMSEEIIQRMQRQRSGLGTFLPTGEGNSLPNFLAATSRYRIVTLTTAAHSVVLLGKV